jgi:YggT family protein
VGAVASFGVVADAITQVERFIYAFTGVYTLLIFAYILTSWIRLPYSLNRVQRFLNDVCEPDLRLFRRILPPLGPVDLSPMIGVMVLWLVEQIVVQAILERLH